MSAICLCEAMYLFVSMYDSTTALLFLLICLHLGTASLYGKRRMNKSPKNKCRDQRSFSRLLKPQYFFPTGFVLMILVQCHVDKLVLPVPWGWCDDWVIHRTWFWFLSPHSIISSPFSLPPVVNHAAWTLFSQWKGRFCLLRWLFWVTFSIFFFLKPYIWLNKI